MEQIRVLLLEYLRQNPTGQYERVTHGVARLAIGRGLLEQAREPLGQDFAYALSPEDTSNLREVVRQELWLLLGQGLLVFGMNEDNPTWPWYRLTERGETVASEQRAQPYDPAGFLREFDNKNPSADPIIRTYLSEATHALNHGCHIAASVMLGAASEKALLVLVETFESAITDAAKQADFAGSYRWTIHSKYRALKTRLDSMIDSGTLCSPLREYVISEIPGAFELIRRQRNEAGHPELYTGIDPDTVFLNLRVFSEYVRRIYDLIEFLNSDGADW